jgi:hypothetical protein
MMKQENWSGGATYTSANETNMQITMTEEWRPIA